MKKFLVWLFCLILLTQPVFAQSEKLIILNTNTGRDTDADTGQNAGAGEQNSSDTTENTDNVNTQQTGNVDISAPSALLMEVSTGKVLYEKNADEKRPPASVTKIMTLLLVFDALDAGKIKLEDPVTVSEYAASMGGSQVFLEPGETQSVKTMIKCIAVASANDAAVAMAEHVGGSEKVFVGQMNKRAEELGMMHTHFKNCNGLDTDGHETTARDIAKMSREMLRKHPQIEKYCKIWLEDITHETKKGKTTFGLSNTNKLIRHYAYATGLKTGSTGKAKFCISATAKKDDVELIAVIMAADDSKKRMKDAISLLEYGFGSCKVYREKENLKLKEIKLIRGKKDMFKIMTKERFSYVLSQGEDISKIKRSLHIKKNLHAPVKKGDKVGTIEYTLDGKSIGTVPVVSKESVGRQRLFDVIREFATSFLFAKS